MSTTQKTVSASRISGYCNAQKIVPSFSIQQQKYARIYKEQRAPFIDSLMWSMRYLCSLVRNILNILLTVHELSQRGGVKLYQILMAQYSKSH